MARFAGSGGFEATAAAAADARDEAVRYAEAASQAGADTEDAAHRGRDAFALLDEMFAEMDANAARFGEDAAKAGETAAGGFRDARDAALEFAVAEDAVAAAARDAAVAGRDAGDADITLAGVERLLADALNARRDATRAVNASTLALARSEADAATAASRGRGVWGFLRRDITLFGGALAGIPFLGTVTGLHLVADAALETAAVLVPATVAFGAFAAAAVPSVQDIWRQMQNLHTVNEALGTSLYPLTGGFSAMAQAVRPEVYQLFGEGLVAVNSKTGEFTVLARDAGHALDQLGARAAAAFTSGGMSDFLKSGAADLAQIGDIIGNIFGTVGNLLRVMPGYAETLLGALDAVTKGVESLTGSGIGQWAAGAFMAFHGFALWAGLGATAAVVLGNSLVGLAVKFGLASEGALAFDAVQFGTGVKLFGSYLADAAIALVTFSGAEDVAVASTGALDAVMMTLGAVNPLVWIGAAIGGLTALVLWLDKSTSATQGYDQAVNAALGNAPVTQLSVDLTQQYAVTATRLQEAQSALNSTQEYGVQVGLHTSGTTQVVTQAYQQQQQVIAGYKGELATLAGYQQNYSTLLKAAGGNLGLLSEAGITSNQILSASKSQMAQYVIEVKAAAAAQQALALGSGRSAASLNALNFQTGAAANQLGSMEGPLQKITQAEDALLNAILGGPQAFISFQQGLGTMSTDAGKAGASLSGLNVNSLTLANDFYSTSVPALQKLSDSLQQQGISASGLTKVIATGAGEMTQYTKGNTEANSVLVDLINNALGPGTVSLRNLNTWVKHNSTSLQGMNSVIAESAIKAGTLAGVLQTQLNAQFHQFLLQESGATAELQKYTGMLMHNQQNTSAGQAARAQLIRDLENAGFSARQAAGYVDGLSSSLGRIPKNTTATVSVTTYQQMITVPGTAPAPGPVVTGHHAKGWRVPGYGGGDTVPIWVEPGEAVVPKHLVAGVAPFLSAHRVPGFAGGGVVPPGGPHGGGHHITQWPQWSMGDVTAAWAKEMWADDMRFGRKGPMSRKEIEEMLAAATAPKHLTGLWKNPLWQAYSHDLLADMQPYAGKDLLWWRLLAEKHAVQVSERGQVAHLEHMIREHERKHQPGWVRYYERKLHQLQAADMRKLSLVDEELMNLRTSPLFPPVKLPHGTYDKGGWLPVGLSVAYNGTGKPEPVGGAPKGSGDVHVHLHGDLADQALWERMQARTLDYGYANTGRPAGVWQPGG